MFFKILTSDDKRSKVGHPRAALWLGDTAIQILILISDFFEVEGGSKPSVVDVFGQSHWNIFSISPLQTNTHRQTDQVLQRVWRVKCLAQGQPALTTDTCAHTHVCVHTLIPLCFADSRFEGHDYNRTIMKSAAIKLLIMLAARCMAWSQSVWLWLRECVLVCLRSWHFIIGHTSPKGVTFSTLFVLLSK